MKWLCFGLSFLTLILKYIIGGVKMGKLVKLKVYQVINEDEKWIDREAELITVDEGDEFTVYQKYTINLDKDSDEEIKKVVEEAKAWTSQSRTRLERARKIAEMLGIPLEITQD